MCKTIIRARSHDLPSPPLVYVGSCRTCETGLSTSTCSYYTSPPSTLSLHDSMSRLTADPSQDPAASKVTDVEMVEVTPQPKSWTYINYRPRGPRGFDNDSVAIASTYGDRLIANVERRMLPRLDKGMWLVTGLVDFRCFEVRNAFIERNPQRLMDLCFSHRRAGSPALNPTASGRMPRFSTRRCVRWTTNTSPSQ